MTTSFGEKRARPTGPVFGEPQGARQVIAKALPAKSNARA
jgi:hypothetical protein